MPKAPLNSTQFFIAIMGSAIILRLLLMPFFAHVDLFSEYRRVIFAIENGHLLDNSHRFLVYNIEMFFGWLTTLLVPITPGLFELNDPTLSTSSMNDYMFFINDPYIFRFLFIFKLPYFIFDLATAVLIWRFVEDQRLRKIALLLWLFNPLTLFATYIFGRFEVISLFFLALTAWQLKQHNRILASLAFGAALMCREINLLFTPILLLSLIDTKDYWLKNAIVISVSVLIIAAAVLFPSALVNLFDGNTALFLDPETARSTDALNKLLSLGYHWFYPVIIGFMAVIFYVWEHQWQSYDERFVIGCALMLFTYFAFNVHSIHYASWLMIFPILAIRFGANIVFACVALWGTWLVLWLLKTDGGVFTFFLMAPLHEDFIGTGIFPNFFNQVLATEQLNLYQAIQIVRAIFASVLAYFAYKLISRTPNAARI